MSAKVYMERLKIPTYRIKPENQNPTFREHCGAHIYPYRLQDRLTSDCVDTEYDAVVLENEYLKLLFLPDFGCRLFSAWDKILSREIFHRNHRIKPALIAVRGAWISGGIEYNFPIGHAIYTHSRIPFTVRENQEGSVSLFFGLTEQMTGMRFLVEVRLAPDEYRFTHRIRLYNGTSVHQRHYWWTNASVPETPRTQFIYPITKATSGAHGGEFPWPMHEGVDLTWAVNHKFAGDIFAAETYDEFFGVYHWDRGCGAAHWAKQEDMPAKKIFSWGQDEMGRLWQRVLNEDAGDYVEIQAGRFATQSDFRLLMPHELVEFEEYWIPVGKTDGFVKAHREGIINILPGSGASKIVFQATRRFSGRISVMIGGLIHERRTRFAPGQVYRFSVPTNQGPFIVKVLDDQGNVLLAYDPLDCEKARRRIPTGSEESPSPVPEASLYHLACNHFVAGNYKEVLDLCAQARDPLLQLLQAAASRKGKISQAVTIPTDDPLWRHASWERYFRSVEAGGRSIPSGNHQNLEATDFAGDHEPSITTEFFQEDMDAAEWYYNLNMIEEARIILAKWKNKVPPADPFFDALANEVGIELPTIRRPDEIGIVNCFAHRETLIRLLEKRSDPESQLHLGNMLYAKGLTEQAIKCWENALSLGGHQALRNLALAHWERLGDVKTAYQFMKKAAAITPYDADSLAGLDELAEMTAMYDERIEIARTILDHACDDSRCLERATRAFLEAGYFDEAVEIVTTRRFFVKELAYQTRILYVRALIERGARLFMQSRYREAIQDFRHATEYPENIGVGRLHDSSDAQAFYLLGLSLEMDSRFEEAQEAWQQAAEDVPVAGSEQAFYVGRARERLKRADSADAFEQILPVGEPDSEFAQARHAYLRGLYLLAKGLDPTDDFSIARRIEAKDPVKMHRYLEDVFQRRSKGRRIPIAVWWAIEPEREMAAL